MSALKSALEKSKELLEHYIEFIDEDWEPEQIESMLHFVKALNAGCDCDDYSGFDCGCGKRRIIYEEAIKELNKE